MRAAGATWGVGRARTTAARGIAGGMPVAGVTGRAEVMDAVHPSGLGGTFGGNPLAWAAGRAAFRLTPAHGPPHAGGGGAGGLPPGGRGGTFGGNPLACAAALAVFDLIEAQGLLERAVQIGDRA